MEKECIDLKPRLELSRHRRDMRNQNRRTALRESRNKGKVRNLPHPKPVDKIELSTEHKRLRLILAVVFLLVGATAIAYGVANLSSKEPGWTEIKVSSSKLHCGGDFAFLYCLGQGTTSASAENKALTAFYSSLVEYAFRMFTRDVEYENVHNIYYINHHPNEEIEVDDCLYQAFSLIQESGNRSLYLGPVYEQYNGLFHCTEEYQAVDYDPYLNPDIAEYYRNIIDFAQEPEAINLELLGGNRICLRVADAYLTFAAQNEIENFIDFYWMKNAFIADYLARELLSAGYSRGTISSIDGFTRNLDSSGESYAYTFYDRAGSVIYPVAGIRYKGPSSIVYLHDYPLNNGQLQYCYVYGDGEIRTAYLDARDGLCRSAVSSMVCYSREYCCAEILLKAIPVYITDTLGEDNLTRLAEERIFSIYSRNCEIRYNDAGLVYDSLYRDENVQYEAVLVK